MGDNSCKEKEFAFLRYLSERVSLLTLLYSERPKLHTILDFLSVIGLKEQNRNHKSCLPLKIGRKKHGVVPIYLKFKFANFRTDSKC